jgi:hypothetical protein
MPTCFHRFIHFCNANELMMYKDPKEIDNALVIQRSMPQVVSSSCAYYEALPTMLRDLQG